MRYLLLFLILLLDLFADCIQSGTFRYSASPNNLTFTCESRVGYWQHTTSTGYNMGTSFLSTHHKLLTSVYASDAKSCIWTYTLFSTDPSKCPSDTIWDPSKCECTPKTCSWATTPPWYKAEISGLNVVSCSNTTLNGLYADDTQKYVGASAWCVTNSTCYFKPLSCPIGQIYNKSKRKCNYPFPPDECDAGWIRTNSSTGIDDITKTCYSDLTCKSNTSLKKRYEVSCGSQNNDLTPIPGPNGDVTPEKAPDQSKKPISDSSSGGGGGGGTNDSCDNSLKFSQLSCTPPNVLSFSCNPTTGEVTKNACTSPSPVNQDTIDSADSTKSATTEDIKKLNNDLPNNIRDALKDYFTDGSFSHLESIRGSLQASKKLQADANDKLDSISETSDASLSTQLKGNEKLDDIKSSVDGVKSSVDGVANSFNSDGQGVLPDNFITDDDFTPSAETKNILESLSGGLESIKIQFSQAKSILSGGVPLVSMGTGSCPSYNIMGHTVSISKIGDSIAPYSSIFSILIYVSIMIKAFGSVFKFLSRGIK